jgi:hypothetical protein
LSKIGHRRKIKIKKCAVNHRIPVWVVEDKKNLGVPPQPF